MSTKDTQAEQEEMLLDLVRMKNEPLHPDLVKYLTESVSGYPLLGHPLVHHMFPINGHANRAYLHKRELLDAAIAEEDWHTAVFLHERPYRCEALIDYVLGRDDQTGEVIPVDASYPQRDLDLVVDVWTDSENIHQYVDEWMQITSAWRPGDPLLLASQAERDEFARLPDELIVWRGDCDDGGWSWSLDPKVGEFFARRFSQNHLLLTGTVSKHDVFGYITRRNEQEVMVRREHVHKIVTLPLMVSGNGES